MGQNLHGWGQLMNFRARVGIFRYKKSGIPAFGMEDVGVGWASSHL